MVRGRALPLIRLHKLFGVEPRSTDPANGLVVIVEHDGNVAALLVDELLGQQQVVIKSLDANFKKTEGIVGATILGDGTRSRQSPRDALRGGWQERSDTRRMLICALGQPRQCSQPLGEPLRGSQRPIRDGASAQG
jgi:hypothetical protein